MKHSVSWILHRNLAWEPPLSSALWAHTLSSFLSCTAHPLAKKMPAAEALRPLEAPCWLPSDPPLLLFLGRGRDRPSGDAGSRCFLKTSPFSSHSFPPHYSPVLDIPSHPKLKLGPMEQGASPHHKPAVWAPLPSLCLYVSHVTLS